MRRLILALAALALASSVHAESMGVSSLYPTQAPSATVATLPSCTSSLRGVRYIVTDALTPVALAAVTGGGAVVVGVTCTGAGWIVG